jgi:hypothetical protein
MLSLKSSSSRGKTGIWSYCLPSMQVESNLRSHSPGGGQMQVLRLQTYMVSGLHTESLILGTPCQLKWGMRGGGDSAAEEYRGGKITWASEPVKVGFNSLWDHLPYSRTPKTFWASVSCLERIVFFPTSCHSSLGFCTDKRKTLRGSKLGQKMGHGAGEGGAGS